MEDVRRRLKIFLGLFVAITAMGTLGFMALEDLPLVKAFYYNIVTMSTVGYGDIHPTSDASRLFALLIIILGGGTFLGAIANATELFLLKRETENRMRKVNMVLGIFFGDVGYELLALFLRFDKNIEETRDALQVETTWKDANFLSARRALKKHDFRPDIHRVDLENLLDFLNENRKTLVSLLENPVLLEREGFSETLLAVFHLAEELNSRDGLKKLPDSDLKHLAGDVGRAYGLLVSQWLVYLQHLKTHYPYLYSLAVRKNPFDPDATPIVH
jgi:hypothetical protein